MGGTRDFDQGATSTPQGVERESPTEEGTPSVEGADGKAKAKARAARKRKVPLAERQLDVETMSLKEVIRWGVCQERAKADADKAEKRRRVRSQIYSLLDLQCLSQWFLYGD